MPGAGVGAGMALQGPEDPDRRNIDREKAVGEKRRKKGKKKGKRKRRRRKNMYNSQLDTFMVAAETKSFAKAARQLYISSSAVIQQINSLEQNLKVSLFVRSNRGLTLTPAGEYLRQEVPRMKAWNDNVREELLRLADHHRETIRVGVPKMHKSRLFYELWAHYTEKHPLAELSFVELTSSDPKEINRTYEGTDLVEFIPNGAQWQQKKDFLPLCEAAIVFAVPDRHRLANRRVLSLEDLRGQKVVVAGGAFMELIREGIEQLRLAGVQLRPIPYYAPAIMDQCMVNQEMMLIPSCSRNIHPSFVTIPCQWEVSLPYGFFYNPDPKPAVQAFLDFVRGKLTEQGVMLPEEGTIEII